ncbi:regenerating islet-derived protein 4-like [Hemicordylus capensis]|uniref:regenerating islet-derived protein 4-like n=1 Tax=Hemicordylus capensis TaxID=884348 RepID=UPI002303BBF0|nr:regenerating islet-derived protein 4-like [Hemicordylus capensis]
MRVRRRWPQWATDPNGGGRCHGKSADTGAATCPGGWIAYQSNCYGLFYERLSWNDAEEECQSYGHNGHLASVLNWAETDVVASYITSFHKNIGPVWIGLKDPWMTIKYRELTQLSSDDMRLLLA